MATERLLETIAKLQAERNGLREARYVIDDYYSKFSLNEKTLAKHLKKLSNDIKAREEINSKKITDLFAKVDELNKEM